MIQTPTLLIGAGPAGLAVAAHLRRRQLPFEMLEQGQAVGPAWRAHYDRLHLHTVKELSHLPFVPFPGHYPRYVSRQQLVDYMDDYARAFDLRPHFGQEVVSITRHDGHWRTETRAGLVCLSRQVVVTTGVNRLPHQPAFAGEDTFGGQILHSRHYRNAAPFQGQRVLVVGMGNTGAEIALDLAENGVEAHLSVRGPVNIVPRDVLGRPTQITALKLAKLPHWLGDTIGVVVRRLTVGDLRPYGIQTPDMPPAKQLRMTGKTPVIDLGTLRAIKAGQIKVRPDIREFTPKGALFADGTHTDYDSVMLATGYRPALPDFIPGFEAHTDEHGVPHHVVAPPPFEGLFFVGFDNYTPGGILGVINRDSAVVAGAIAAAH